MSAQATALADGGDVAVQALGEEFTHLSGRVVPYGVTADVGLFRESFVYGAFTASLTDVVGKIPLLLWHDHQSFPIGMGQDWDERRDGLYGRFKIAHTAVAQVAAQHARDDFLIGMSVGFVPIRSQWTYATDWDPDAGRLDEVTRHEARLMEVSLTPTPAYVGAVVTSVEADGVSPQARSHLREAQGWLRARRHLHTTG